MFVVLGFWLVLLSACGREMTHTNQMTQTEAMDTLSSLPKTGGDANSQELLALMQELSDSGQIQDSRGAISGADLSTLSTILSLLSGGGANSISSLVSGLVSAAGGSATQTKFNLDSLMSILNAALPVITALAPQYAPIIAAVMTIIPVVINVIKMFKKPTAALGFAPRFA
jgi:hypothetical protein